MERHTIDLEREADDLENERLPEIEDAIDDLVESFREDYDSFEDVPQDDVDAYDVLETERTNTQGDIRALRQAVEEWGDGVFVIEELSMGDVGQIQDVVSEKSFEFDAQRGEVVDGVPKQGFGKIETLRYSIIESPDGAPDDPADYPHRVGEYLFEQINSFNTMGDGDMGNLSLRERMGD